MAFTDMILLIEMLLKCMSTLITSYFNNHLYKKHIILALDQFINNRYKKSIMSILRRINEFSIDPNQIKN